MSSITSGNGAGKSATTLRSPIVRELASPMITDGRALPNDELPASLLLPMGRMGPAFLAYANFAAYTEWNNSLIYSTTAGYLASRIAGAAPMRKPAGPVAQLPFNELKELQQLLVRTACWASRAAPP